MRFFVLGQPQRYKYLYHQQSVRRKRILLCTASSSYSRTIRNRMIVVIISTILVPFLIIMIRQPQHQQLLPVVLHWRIFLQQVQRRRHAPITRVSVQHHAANDDILVVQAFTATSPSLHSLVLKKRFVQQQQRQAQHHIPLIQLSLHHRENLYSPCRRNVLSTSSTPFQRKMLSSPSTTTSTSTSTVSFQSTAAIEEVTNNSTSSSETRTAFTTCVDANDTVQQQQQEQEQEIEHLTKTWRTHPAINPKIEFPVWVCNGKHIQSVLQSNIIQPYLATQYEVLQHLHVRLKVVRTTMNSETKEIGKQQQQQQQPQQQAKVILLQPNTPKIQDLPTNVQVILNNAGCIDGLEMYSIQFQYHQFTASYLLNQLLPKSVHPVPTAFETVGHVAHLNLKDHHYPYRTLIGEVIYETLPNIETVIQKIGNVTGPYRTFDYEVLATKSRKHNNSNPTQVQLSESGITLQFDLQHVYWCSRLSEERQRLLKSEILPSLRGCHEHNTSRTVIVADAFCGVGAICIQAALSHPNIVIWANDWNPYATKTLYENAIRNNMNLPYQLPRLTTNDAYTFLMDIGMTATDSSSSRTTGSETTATNSFDGNNVVTASNVERSYPRRRKYHRYSNTNKKQILDSIANQPEGVDVGQQMSSFVRLPDHVLMNFPLEAPNFLGALRWWSPNSCCKDPVTSNGEGDPGIDPNMDRVSPRIHVYTFAKDDSKDDSANEIGVPVDDGKKSVTLCDNNNNKARILVEEEIAVNMVADNLLPQFPSSSSDRYQNENQKQFEGKGNLPQGRRHRRKELNDEYSCNVHTHIVRDVAPGKVVVCVSFTVTAKLLRHMRGDYL